MYACMHVCMYVCMYVRRTYVCMYVCTRIYIDILIHTYMDIRATHVSLLVENIVSGLVWHTAGALRV